MTLRDPQWLWLLVPVVGLAAAYLALTWRRRRDIEAFAEPEMFARLTPQRSPAGRHLAAGAVALSLVALTIGLARPAHTVKIPRQQAIVMLAIDTSASMAANDVSPDRLEAAVQTAKEFVKQVPARFQVGLVAFSDNAQVLATPTTDHRAVIDAIDGLTLGRGTATGNGLEAALQTIEASLGARDSKEAATIVLLSDGVPTVGVPVDAAAQEAAKDGIPVSTIAFGTSSGLVQVGGQIVSVPADPATMKEIADITGGRTFQAASIGELRAVYQDLQGRIGYTTQQHGLDVEFLAAGMAALVAAAGVSLALRGRVL